LGAFVVSCSAWTPTIANADTNNRGRPPCQGGPAVWYQVWDMRPAAEDTSHHQPRSISPRAAWRASSFRGQTGPGREGQHLMSIRHTPVRHVGGDSTARGQTLLSRYGQRAKHAAFRRTGGRLRLKPIVGGHLDTAGARLEGDCRIKRGCNRGSRCCR
jgi:hypothetical protein